MTDVYRNPSGRWGARLRHQGVRHHLGTFGSEGAARRAIREERERIQNGKSLLVSETHPHTLASFAELLGAKVGTVKRWAAEGMPVLRCNGIVRVNQVEASVWIFANHRKSIAFHRESVVYIAFRPSDGAYKVGFTSDLKRRLSELGEVRLVACLPGDKGDELKLHRRFADSSLGGEWFGPSLAIEAYVQSLKVAA